MMYLCAHKPANIRLNEKSLRNMTRTHLTQHIFEKRSYLCVGLDPETGKLPAPFHGTTAEVLPFNKAIIDATRDLCVSYKINTAFYEALGVEGWRIFEETVRYIGAGHFIIADAKRGDIGNTARMYAEAFFRHYGCDAVTVAPYMGEDSIRPFLEYSDKWTILLAHTSNPGHRDFQQLALSDGGGVVWEQVVRRCAAWGTPENTMFVMGAVDAEQIAVARRLVPRHFLLVPGVGAQGGDFQRVSADGLTDDGGLLINISREILYASRGTDFAEAARAKAAYWQKQMEQCLKTYTKHHLSIT